MQVVCQLQPRKDQEPQRNKAQLEAQPIEMLLHRNQPMVKLQELEEI